MPLETVVRVGVVEGRLLRWRVETAHSHSGLLALISGPVILHSMFFFTTQPHLPTLPLSIQLYPKNAMISPALLLKPDIPDGLPTVVWPSK